LYVRYRGRFILFPSNVFYSVSNATLSFTFSCQSVLFNLIYACLVVIGGASFGDAAGEANVAGFLAHYNIVIVRFFKITQPFLNLGLQTTSVYLRITHELMKSFVVASTVDNVCSTILVTIRKLAYTSKVFSLFESGKQPLRCTCCNQDCKCLAAFVSYRSGTRQHIVLCDLDVN